MDNIKYDQHFLNSKNTLHLEADLANIKSNEIILEIGPGDGRLTKLLLDKKPKKLISIELDENLKENLENIKKNYSNFDYIIGNALEIIDNLEVNKLISNIPYSITEKLYEKILEKKIPFALLLHGISFYNIIMSNRSKWSYFVKSFYEIEKVKEIAGNAFVPKTKTMSILIILKLKKNENIEKKDLFFQKLFEKKERNTQNAILFSLVDSFNITKKEAKKIIEKINIDENIKSKKIKNLSNKEFLEIIEKIKF